MTMRFLIWLTLVLSVWASQLAAQDVVADLSQNRVGITASFDGSEILIFGAIQRDAPMTDTEKLDVIITISGPLTPVMVRKKSKVAAIWLNTEAVEVDSAPSFYKIATSAPIQEILSETADLRHKISIPRAIRSVGAPEEILDATKFTEALIRIRTADGLYRVEEGAVSILDRTLFRSQVALPSNLIEGDYTARIFLLRDKDVIAQHDTQIDVRKVGLERLIYRLAHDQPLAYGLLSLAIAILAGWGASVVFQYIRT
ncbi:MAG: hypothetical protein ACI9IV_001103 [Paracoccaceae bacterium]|jgi:uncharacterized protein (TIGR02186 family)